MLQAANTLPPSSPGSGGTDGKRLPGKQKKHPCKRLSRVSTEGAGSLKEAAHGTYMLKTVTENSW